jgi:hypothetical protein
MKSLKKNLIFGLLLVAFIMVSEIVLARLALPAWPAFMVMIFFFVAHEDITTAPKILIGGLAGISCVVLIDRFIHALTGTWAMKRPRCCLSRSSSLPSSCSRTSFPGFSTVTPSCSFSWGPGCEKPGLIASGMDGVELIAGSIFIAGVLGIVKMTALLTGAGKE